MHEFSLQMPKPHKIKWSVKANDYVQVLVHNTPELPATTIDISALDALISGPSLSRLTKACREEYEICRDKSPDSWYSQARNLLPGIVPTGIIRGRRDKHHIDCPSGLVMRDDDHLDKYDLTPEELKELYSDFSSCVYAYTSPSGNGLKSLWVVPLELYKTFPFYAVWGAQMQLIDDWLDNATQGDLINVHSYFAYINHDPVPYVNKNATPEITHADCEAKLAIGDKQVTKETFGKYITNGKEWEYYTPKFEYIKLWAKENLKRSEWNLIDSESYGTTLLVPTLYCGFFEENHSDGDSISLSIRDQGEINLATFRYCA